MTQQIKIHDGKLELLPGGLYDMKEGNETEFAVAKLHLLVANIEKMIEIQCDCSEVQDERTPYGTELMAIAEKFYDSHYRDLVENYSLHKIEFPASKRYPNTIPTWLEEEPWVDQSWHNDVAPSFFHPDCEIVVWVHPDNEDHREYSIKKFFVNKVDVDKETGGQEYAEELYECETEAELKHWLETASL
jgi:hypothetical protein